MKLEKIETGYALPAQMGFSVEDTIVFHESEAGRFMEALNLVVKEGLK
jgi:hypothetical protein